MSFDRPAEREARERALGLARLCEQAARMLRAMIKSVRPYGEADAAAGS